MCLVERICLLHSFVRSEQCKLNLRGSSYGTGYLTQCSYFVDIPFGSLNPLFKSSQNLELKHRFSDQLINSKLAMRVAVFKLDHYYKFTPNTTNKISCLNNKNKYQTRNQQLDEMLE